MRLTGAVKNSSSDPRDTGTPQHESAVCLCPPKLSVVSLKNALCSIRVDEWLALAKLRQMLASIAGKFGPPSIPVGDHANDHDDADENANHLLDEPLHRCAPRMNFVCCPMSPVRA